MKKFVSGVMVGALLAGSIGYAAQYIADTATFKVMVNGKEFNSDKPIVAIEGSTYLPLKAIGEALGVPVQWNAELKQVEVGNNAAIDSADVENYIIKEVWNNGFWWISNYIDGSYIYYMDMYTETFASSNDEEFNINKIENKIIETKSIIEEYNKIFANNEKWAAFYNEYNRLYDLIKNKTYNKDNFNTTYFEKVRDEFCESLK